MRAIEWLHHTDTVAAVVIVALLSCSYSGSGGIVDRHDRVVDDKQRSRQLTEYSAVRRRRHHLPRAVSMSARLDHLTPLLHP